MPNKLLNKDKKQLAFAPSSLILANYIFPIKLTLGKNWRSCARNNFDEIWFQRAYEVIYR
jgi:hypothetical protein